MSADLTIFRAGLDDLDRVATLFDGYRQFYEQASDPDGAKAFICDRITKNESVIFLALHDQEGGPQSAGFVQLYPIFSSVSMVRVWLLNDLFVHPKCRRLGVGRALMERAIAYGRETGSARVELATAADNHEAQALYEDLGFERQQGFYHYSLRI